MLKAYRIVYLSPTSIIRSFTLFGAICWNYKLIYGKEKLEDLLNEFIHNPPFFISSAFPYIKDQFLFPKPILPLKGEKIDFETKIQRKAFKKAQFVTFSIFKEILEGNIKYEEDFSRFNIKSGIIQEKELELKLEITRHTQVRNLISRNNHSSLNLYFIESDYKLYDEYFLIYFLNNNFIKEINNIFKLIEENGIGGKKSIGWGKVQIQEIENEFISEIEKKINFKNKCFVTLSPIIPSQNIISNNSYYEIETIKSYTDSTFEKKFLKNKVLYLKEGSLIVKSEDKLTGLLKNVGNNIYQYGLEFPLEVKLCTITD
jgi:CRISPR-associated protein Csm4